MRKRHYKTENPIEENRDKGNLIVVNQNQQGQYHRTINLTSLLDKNLSFKAKGLHNYIMTRPDNWQLWTKVLFSISTDKETSIRSAINELINNNYLYRTTVRDKKKKIKNWIYIAFPTPTKMTKLLLGNLNIGNLNLGNLNLGNQDYSNKNNSNKNNSNSIINNTIDKSNNIYSLFLDEWNKNKIIIHRKITSKKQAAIKKALKDYTQEEIFKAFQNYATVLHSSDYFWSYTWTMEDFLQRGLHKFVDEANPLTVNLSNNSFQENQPQAKLSLNGCPFIGCSYSKPNDKRQMSKEVWQEFLEDNTETLMKADIWKENHKPSLITVFNGVVSMQEWLNKVDFSIHGGGSLSYRIKPLNKLIDCYIACIDDWWGNWMHGVKDNVFDPNSKIFKMFIREMETSFPTKIKIESDGWVNDSDWEPRD